MSKRSSRKETPEDLARSDGRPAMKEAKVANAVVVQPSAEDVLLGRGNIINSHPGNVRYRKTILDTHQQYNSLKSRFLKTQLTEQVVDEVKGRNGRFLQKEGVNWVEADDEVARVKVSQALRYRSRKDASKGAGHDVPYARKASPLLTDDQILEAIGESLPDREIHDQSLP